MQVDNIRDIDHHDLTVLEPFPLTLIRVTVPEPYQAGEPKDICVMTGMGRWGVKRRMSVQPFALPSELPR